MKIHSSFISAVVFALPAALAIASLRQSVNADLAATATQELQQAQARAEAAAERATHSLATEQTARAVTERKSVALQSIVFTDAPATPPPKDEDPEALLDQEQHARGYRAQLAAKYTPFYLKHGLSPETVDRLEIALTDHWQKAHDLTAVAERRQFSNAKEGVETLRKAQFTELLQTERTVLGFATHLQFLDYERSVPAREYCTSLAERLYYTPTPLNGAQAEALTQILAQNSAAFARGGIATEDDIDWPKVLQQAAPLLSPEQMNALRDKTAANEAMRTEMQRIKQLLDETESATP